MCATSQQYHSMLHLFFFNDTATTEIYTLSLHDALPISGGGVLADRVAQFAMAAREALASGIAVNNPAAFAAALRRVGDLLARSGTGDEEALATELDTLTAALGTIRPGAAPAPFPSAPRPAPT